MDHLEGETLIEISLDHISVGQLGNESFLYLPVAPGEHKISRRYNIWRPAAQFTAEAGKNYFFVDSYNFFLGDRTTPISESEGKAFAQTFTLSSLCGPGWAERYAATQGGEASFIYDNVLPAMPVKAGFDAAPTTIRFWAPRGGVGNIQAGLMNSMGRVR